MGSTAIAMADPYVCEFTAQPWVQGALGAIGAALSTAIGLLWRTLNKERGRVAYLNKQLVEAAEAYHVEAQKAAEAHRRDLATLAEERRQDLATAAQTIRRLTDSLRKLADGSGRE